MRLQLWAWAGALLVVVGALVWSALRASPTPSPLGGVPQVRAAARPGGAQVDPLESPARPGPTAPRPGLDPYAPEHPPFDQGQFERELEAARPSREPH